MPYFSLNIGPGVFILIIAKTVIFRYIKDDNDILKESSFMFSIHKAHKSGLVPYVLFKLGPFMASIGRSELWEPEVINTEFLIDPQVHKRTCLVNINEETVVFELETCIVRNTFKEKGFDPKELRAWKVLNEDATKEIFPLEYIPYYNREGYINSPEAIIKTVMDFRSSLKNDLNSLTD